MIMLNETDHPKYFFCFRTASLGSSGLINVPLLYHTLNPSKSKEEGHGIAFFKTDEKRNAVERRKTSVQVARSS